MFACCLLDVPKITAPKTMKGFYNQNTAPTDYVTPKTQLGNLFIAIGGDAKQFSQQGDAKQFPQQGDRKTLTTLLVQLEETEEQIEILQQFQSDLLAEIARIRRQLSENSEIT